MALSTPSILLSICIPTYNHGPYIKPLLEKLVPQLSEDIEIVISNNASRDNTDDIVQPFVRAHPNIRYSKNESNIGFDRNVLKLISLARGKYCWIMGSDDLVPDDAVAVLRKEFERDLDIYLFDFAQYNKKLEYLRTIKLFKYGHPSKTYNFTKREDILEYLQAQFSIVGIFSFISAFAFKRESWNSVKEYEKAVDSQLIHSFFLISMVKNGAQLAHLDKALVHNRIGNEDPELCGGDPVKRMLLDITQFGNFTRWTFPTDKELANAYLHVLRRHRNWKHIAKLRAESNYKVWVEKAEPRLHEAGYNPLMLFIYRYCGWCMSIAWIFAETLCRQIQGKKINA